MTCSVYSLVLLSLGQCILVTFKTSRYLKLVKKNRFATILMVLVWLIGIVYSLPGLLSIKLDQSFDGSYACGSKWNEQENNKFFIREFIFLFFIPFTIIFVSSTKLVLFLKNSNANFNAKYTHTSVSNESKDLENSRSALKQKKNNVQKKAIKMLLAIVVLFIIQWSPIWLFEFFTTKHSKYLQLINLMATIFSHSNSISNPIIYIILSHNFPFIVYLKRCFESNRYPIVV